MSLGLQISDEVVEVSSCRRLFATMIPPQQDSGPMKLLVDMISDSSSMRRMLLGAVERSVAAVVRK